MKHSKDPKVAARALEFIKRMNRAQKQTMMLCVDLVLVPLALIFTYVVQGQVVAPASQFTRVWPVIALLIVMAAALSTMLRIPQTRLNAYDMSGVGKTALFAALMTLAGFALGQTAGLGYSAGFYVVFGLVFFLFSAASRVAMLHILLGLYRRDMPRRRVLIYGAGTTGVQLASALRNHKSINPVAFADDNAALQGLTVSGLPVLKPARIQAFVKEHDIGRVLLAMPSLSSPKQHQIARHLKKMGLEVQALPSFAQLVGEEELVNQLVPILAGQLLGRASLDEAIRTGTDQFTGKSVLVSGAGGSIGSELCRQVLGCQPACLVLYELNELALYNADMELRALAEGTGIEIVPILGSVTDARLVRRVLQTHKVEFVLHAAAYKHVPLVERNPLAGLANNVLGTSTLARESIAAGVKRFTLISSDKAVRPTNVMGASKRLAELVVQDLALRSGDTVLAMVRFGNVLGSSGSVIPLFQDQIAHGGPITLTHSDVTRYFMTIEEAVRLVLRATSFAKGGEVFVLDMGMPVPISKLARQVIEASGYTVRDQANPEGDIEIVITGLRPGEKLHEELLINEGHLTTAHEKIFAAREAGLSEIEVASALRALREAVAQADEAAALAVVRHWVEGYSQVTANLGP